VPVWLPWPLPSGWLVSGFSGAGDERAGVRASAVSLSGPNPLGGPADMLIIAEEPGVGLGAGLAGLPGPDPGDGFAVSQPNAVVKVAHHVAPLWLVESDGKAVFVGEVEANWVWLVLWPDTAGTLLVEPLPLLDLRDPAQEFDIPFGALSTRLPLSAPRRATMAPVRIDLHVHSSASDGTDPPAEVVRRAAAAGLDVLALTDHDTQAGVAPARAALPPGLTLLPGMELSCQLDDRSVHLLCYLFDPADPALSAETAQIRDDRVYRARAMTQRLRELGADVSWEQVSAIAGDAVVGRPHLARALAASGAIADPADAFTAEWIGDGGRAFVDRYAPGLARAVGLVRAAGGVPVLAHPRSPGYEIPDAVIAELAGAGLAGVEVFHPDHDRAERDRLTGLARSLDLISTGGSDDHGTFLPGGPGASAAGHGLGAETTPPAEYERLLALAFAAQAP
jgi:3',5'-nucleoside bisphosphate phosphatase